MVKQHNEMNEFMSIIDFINENREFLSNLSQVSFMSLMGMLGDEYGAKHPEFIPCEAWKQLSLVSGYIYEEMGYSGVGE